MSHGKTGPRLRLEVEDLDLDKTQPFRRPSSNAPVEVIRPNPLFCRVAAILGQEPDSLCVLLSPWMTRADVVPQALTRAHLVQLLAGLLEIIDTTLPRAQGMEARERLCALVEGEPPAPP